MRKMVFSLDPDAIGRLRVEPRGKTFPRQRSLPSRSLQVVHCSSVRQQFVEPPFRLEN